MFPGQGTQFPGMARGLNLKDKLGVNLSDIMDNGPVSELNSTLNAQPAIFASSLEMWKKSGLDSPDMVMGHSLGEYTGLVASGALDENDALGLVKKRAGFMNDIRGSMAAVMGFSPDEVQDVLGDLDVWVSNINTSRQVVISGRTDAVKTASEALKQQGAKRVVPLRVGVASHCPLMEPARVRLEDCLEAVPIDRPRCPVVFNATAAPEYDTRAIKEVLCLQLVSPLKWMESVLYAASRGIEHFIEIGPRSVLAPLVKRILPDAHVEVRVIK
ncbi:MAG: ACP S-malonyltransferase [Thermodesulfobacteriota bacterium]|nr:ACP S-malonyltransferase [Thermodesulfobacteriota bacterium]